MKLGTKSLLFGAHQFILHPYFVLVAYTKLYGFPFDPRIWLAILVHDWGYWGKESMDDAKGQTHPELGGKIMEFLFGKKWGDFTKFHSRYYAKLEGKLPSKLCAADKYVLHCTPEWLYLWQVKASGEVWEYIHLADNRKFYQGDNIRYWYLGLKEFWLKEVDRLAPNNRRKRP